MPWLFLRASCLLSLLLLGVQRCETLAAADDSQDLHQQAVQWVGQLASDSFRQRQQAERELAALGVPAKAALMQGLKSADAEVRERCRRLLVVVLEQDYQARVDAFAADAQGSTDHQLPGWRRFRELAGETAGARQLFVEMQRSESKLLESSAADPDAGSDLLLSRCEDLQQAASRQLDDDGRPLSLGSIAAAFFVGADPRVPINERLAAYLYNFSYQPALQGAMRGGAKLEPLKRILGAWVARTAGSTNSYPSMMLAMQYDLREGLSPALNVIKQTGAQPHILQFAILVVGRFGEKQHLALLEPLLENASPLVTQNVGGQQLRCEVRDVALATLVHLSQQDFKQYGLVHLQKNAQTLFNINSVGFASEQLRSEALRKWKAWSAAQKGKP
jgi:hypothetical protein